MRYLYIFYLFLIVTIVGCSKDNSITDAEVQELPSGIVPSDLNSQDLKKHPEVLEALNKFRESGNKGKQGDEIYYFPLNIFIQVGMVRYIEKEGFQSYTFPVRKNYEDRKIMNLVLYRKGEDQFNATFVLYDFTPDELYLLNQKELES